MSTRTPSPRSDAAPESDLILPRLDGLAYGGDYNPEQWPEEVWKEDMRLMQRAGVNLVSVAIFSWARLNPGPGQWDFGWLDRLMDLLHAHKIKACLATATASPPPWFLRAHPDVCPVKHDGTAYTWGSRQCYTPCAPAYLEAVAGLAHMLARRYGQHPALAAWHVNNEYGCQIPLSYGPHDARAFREWLKARYKTLDGLNDAWGTDFWSQRIYDWEEVQPVMQTPAHHNPAAALDYRRFFSDALLGAYRAEATALREITPDVPLTTNFMGINPALDQFAWAGDVDFASLDNYPEQDPAELGRTWGDPASMDLTRGAKGNRPWLLLEQTASQVQWRNINHNKRPGVMRLQSMQALAHGADGLMFFQWRASQVGAERYHGAMLPHSGPESRVFREICGLGVELKLLAEIRGTTVESQTAMAVSWDNMWNFQQHDKPRKLDYHWGVMPHVHAAMRQTGNVADIVPPDGDLSRFKFIVMPACQVMPEHTAAHLAAWVQAGGVLVTTFLTGTQDGTTRIWPGACNPTLRKLMGVRIMEWEPVANGQSTPVRLDDGTVIQTGCFNEIVEPEGAEVLATYAADYFAGSPALTRNRVGAGTVYHLGTLPSVADLTTLLSRLYRAHGIMPPVEAPAGVEVVVRSGAGRRYLFLLNHSEANVTVPLGKLSGRNLLDGTAMNNSIPLEKRGVAVISMDPACIPGYVM